jgi:hypothetical protein
MAEEDILKQGVLLDFFGSGESVKKCSKLLGIHLPGGGSTCYCKFGCQFSQPDVHYLTQIEMYMWLPFT